MPERDQHVAEVQPGGPHRDPDSSRRQRLPHLRARHEHQVVERARRGQRQPPLAHPARYRQRAGAGPDQPRHQHGVTADRELRLAGRHRRATPHRGCPSPARSTSTNRPGCSDCADAHQAPHRRAPPGSDSGLVQAASATAPRVTSASATPRPWLVGQTSRCTLAASTAASRASTSPTAVERARPRDDLGLCRVTRRGTGPVQSTPNSESRPSPRSGRSAAAATQRLHGRHRCARYARPATDQRRDARRARPDVTAAPAPRSRPTACTRHAGPRERQHDRVRGIDPAAQRRAAPRRAAPGAGRTAPRRPRGSRDLGEDLVAPPPDRRSPWNAGPYAVALGRPAARRRRRGPPRPRPPAATPPDRRH